MEQTLVMYRYFLLLVVGIMFVGKYDNTIDDKFRLIIPSRFREELGDTCVLAKSLDECLTIYPMEEWRIFLDKLDKLPTSNPKARMLKRHFTAYAYERDIDKQGRLTIPQELREDAGIKKELVTIGSNKYIEVWSRESWREQLNPDTGELIDASEIAESLEEYGF